MVDRNTVAQQALALSPEDRAYVAEVLDRSLSTGSFATSDIADAWSQEIDRRLEAYERGDMPAVDADLALRRLRQALEDRRASRKP